jgi:glucosamine kinase
MSSTNWFVGVEADSTRTRAVILDGLGTELGTLDGPGAFTHAEDPNAAAFPIAELVRRASTLADQELPCTALWAGVSGTSRGTVIGSIEIELQRAGLASNVHVDSGAEAAFHDVFGDGAGILLVAGTGSEGRGRNAAGAGARVGGWGSLLGDEGSGYAIGLESLRRVARDEDGRGPETKLRDAILSRLELSGVDALVRWAATADRATVARLTNVVVDSSRTGDAVAGDILVRAVEELSGHVHAMLTNLGPWEMPPSVSLSGWLIRKGGPLRRAMELALSEHQLVVVDRDPDAARGAAKLAFVMGK